MTDKNTNSDVPEQGNPSSEALENCEQLVWMYLDDVLPEEELPKLETMLQEDESFIRVYLDCVQLHGDLGQHFQPSQPLKLEGLPESPVLGSLMNGLTDTTNGPPVA